MSKLEQLAEVSWSEIERVFGQRKQMPPSKERENLFQDDLAKLGKLMTGEFPRSDMRDSSVILYRWLFDEHAVLQDRCDELGIQLSLPGESDHAKAYHAEIEKDKPIYGQSIQIGRKSLLGFKWVPLSEFGSGRAFIVNGHTVSHEAFIKFVRNKLGGGHFDAEDRKRWQKDLAALEAYVGGLGAMNHHMKQIVGAVLDAVASCGVH